MRWLLLLLVLVACKSKTTTINGETFGIIPGADVSRIRTDLQRSGFRSFKDANQRPVSYSFSRATSNHEEELVLTGSTPSDIIRIEATFLGVDSTINDKAAKSFIGWVAQIPAGNKPAAEAWAHRNLYGYDIDTIISGVRFNIKTKSSRISLKIRTEDRY